VSILEGSPTGFSASDLLVFVLLITHVATSLSMEIVRILQSSSPPSSIEIDDAQARHTPVENRRESTTLVARVLTA